MIRLLLIVVVGNIVSSVFGQRMTHRNDFTSLYILDRDRHNNFEISASLVAVFTTGAADRNGFRIGGGLFASKTIGNWTFSAGLDAYKALSRFGLGTTSAGIIYDTPKTAASYYLNKYHQGEKQMSGIVGVRIRDFEIKFEDDILSLPFTGFRVYDRYRTAALELRYRQFLLGMNVYTSEPNGLTDASLYNRKGVYKEGNQISSPLYLGYTDKNLMVRYGWNSNLGGYTGQNSWHRSLFDTGDFKSVDYRNQFLQVGTYKPYTLY